MVLSPKRNIRTLRANRMKDDVVYLLTTELQNQQNRIHELEQLNNKLLSLLAQYMAQEEIEKLKGD